MPSSTTKRVLTCCLALLYTTAAAVTAEVDAESSNIRGSADNDTTNQVAAGRQLRYARNKLEWDECMDNNLSAEKCKQLVESHLNKGHILENIEVIIKYPDGSISGGTAEDEPDTAGDIQAMAEEKKAEMPPRVKVPVNYMGQVVTNSPLGEGVVTYPKQWDGIRTGPRDIGPWDCRGMNALQCCGVIKRDVRDRDSSHKYLDCVVEEQDPIPFLNGRRIQYCAWEFVDGQYTPVYVHENRFKVFEARAKEMLRVHVFPQVRHILENGTATYNKLGYIKSFLNLHGRGDIALQGSSSLIDTYLHPPNRSTTVFELDSGAGSGLREILEDLESILDNYLTAHFEIPHVVQIEAGDDAGTHVKHLPTINGHEVRFGPRCVPN